MRRGEERRGEVVMPLYVCNVCTMTPCSLYKSQGKTKKRQEKRKKKERIKECKGHYHLFYLSI